MQSFFHVLKGKRASLRSSGIHNLHVSVVSQCFLHLLQFMLFAFFFIFTNNLLYRFYKTAAHYTSLNNTRLNSANYYKTKIKFTVPRDKLQLVVDIFMIECFTPLVTSIRCPAMTALLISLQCTERARQWQPSQHVAFISPCHLYI